MERDSCQTALTHRSWKSHPWDQSGPPPRLLLHLLCRLPHTSPSVTSHVFSFSLPVTIDFFTFFFFFSFWASPPTLSIRVLVITSELLFLLCLFPSTAAPIFMFGSPDLWPRFIMCERTASKHPTQRRPRALSCGCHFVREQHMLYCL